MSSIKEANTLGNLLIVFTRYPEPGKTKTRLIPVLGPEGACELHRCMAEDTMKWALQLKRGHMANLEVRYNRGTDLLMKEWLGEDVWYRNQGDGDLGKRMSRAFKEAFQSKMESVIIVGTDCLDLGVDIVNSAFTMLTKIDAVIGPAKDGGYYLIGFRADTFLPETFEGIHWGAKTVLQETIKILKFTGCTVHLLKERGDVDRFFDLKELFHRGCDTRFSALKTISFLRKHERIFR
ncbi:MAG: TIGR04282 family arsenosugar biosynthesis glycosyltransferase [Thermodesulfobacteriota bacterium]|nr:TIGR04282 family arsenosugar biosynthesis glycosyltransferase [Thermodesulfobacteriota bacterium]